MAGPTPRRTLIVRGVVFSVVAVVAAVLLVGRGAGVFDTGATATVMLPAEAGRVPVDAPVYHLGVKVGDVRESEGTRVPAGSGVAGGGDDDDDTVTVPGTRVEMLIGGEFAERIPSDVLVRVVPRTLFGDIRLDLVSPDAATGNAPLTSGAELHADTSEEAVLLYDVFTRASDLLAASKPQDLQVTLTALARALDGRGELLGRTISDADRAGADLSPALENAADASPDLARLTEDLADATPEILATVEEATRLSQIVLDRPGSISRLLDAGLASTRSGVLMADQTVPGAIRLVNDTGVVFDRTARNPHGVIRTLYAMRPMGEAGTTVFQTGRFNITAVPSFADPMPYGPQDCPRYPGLDGSTCTGAPAPAAGAGADPGHDTPAQLAAGPAPVPGAASEVSRTINAAAEREYLREPQSAAASEPGSPVPPSVEADPAAAAWTMLAPLVRGTEVTIR
ncbi:ABC transporter substrate-binding protein [Dietzia sp. NCCP-2495]|uniref:MCE family protein n=1 Tax=Dietzia sp. NCCP-2495 TaxID=2934675 RepID=UPI002230A3D5|nr:MCE family protein [Dietzia sp. NCCP-2495]GLB63317.1 ABC transporter substrate-binding protein [Dietzia sp. NCCP-2495]